MSCPHLSKVNGDCLLLQDPGPDTDDGREPAQAELVPPGEGVSPLRRAPSLSRECRLAPSESYRACPVFRRFLAELAP